MPAGLAKPTGLVPLRRGCRGPGRGLHNWEAPNGQAIIWSELAVEYMHQEFYVPHLRGSQTWLTVGITCGALKIIPMLGSHCSSINSAISGALDIRVVQKLPRWPSGAATIENYCLTVSFPQQPHIIGTILSWFTEDKIETLRGDIITQWIVVEAGLKPTAHTLNHHALWLPMAIVLSFRNRKWGSQIIFTLCIK